MAWTGRFKLFPSRMIRVYFKVIRKSFVRLFKAPLQKLPQPGFFMRPSDLPT